MLAMHNNYVSRFYYINIIMYFPGFVLYVGEQSKYESIDLCCDCMRGQIIKYGLKPKAFRIRNKYACET